MKTSEEKREPYDLEKVYDEQILPLMQKILDICQEHKMPMLATFQYRSYGDGSYDSCTSNLDYPSFGHGQATPMRLAFQMVYSTQPPLTINVGNRN